MELKKRLSGLLALLLCLCLALSLVPGTAFAEGDELPVAPYCTWEKATVLTPGAPVSFVPDTYHNDYTAEQLWFAVNVDGDDLAICMDFDVKSYLEVKLYDAAVLGESGPSYNNSRRSKTVSGTQTLSWKVPFAGVYYLMLRPGGSGYESDKAGSLTVSLLDGDTNEPNDTLETAAPLTVNVDTVYNLNGSNDEDWFKITTLKAGQAVKTVLTGFNYETKPVTVVLCDAEGNALTYHRGISADTEFYWKAGEPADYYLKLVSYQSDAFVPQSLKVRFELVDGDPNENNDGWQAAAELSAEVTSYYTLTGYNDEDWFKLSTLNPGEAIKVTLAGFDYTSKTVEASLYSGAKLAEEPDRPDKAIVCKRSTRSDFTFRWKANEPGDYYLRLKLTGEDTVNLREHSVVYGLVSGDEYELNDTWQTAAPIPQDGYEMEFSLNGDNDVDWFRFETELENDVVTLSLRGFETDYSNYIRYQVYDIDEGGNYTSLTYDDVSITHERTFLCPNPGVHYIRVAPHNSEGGSFENLLKLKIEHRSLSIDEGEPNDTWQQAAAVNPDVAAVFNLPAGTDTDWFKFSVAEPNQTLDLRVTLPASTKGNLNVSVWSEAELNQNGDRAENIRSWSEQFTGPETFRAMLGTPGVYYVCLSRTNGFEEDGTVTCSLLPPDGFEGEENNNNWKRAAPIAEGVVNDYTLPAANDTDWFKFTTDEPNQTVEVILDIPAEKAVIARIWSAAELWTKGDNADSLTYYSYQREFSAGVRTLRWTLGEAGDYLLRITPYYSSSSYETAYAIDSGATVTYRLIEPDGGEGNLGNNTWENATAITEGVAAIFTQPAKNDDDWFKITALKDNQTLELELTIPEGGGVNNPSVYSGADLNANGSRADPIGYINISSGASGRMKNRCMLGAAGEYYIRVQNYGDPKYFERDATLTYRLLDGDALERNNTWQTATVLPRQTTAAFTLRAYNDSDWFLLGQADAGDQVCFTITGDPTVNNLRYGLSCKGEYDGSPYIIIYDSSFSNGKTITYTAGTTGDYYLRVFPYNSGLDAWADAVFTVRSTVVRDATPVTGLEVTSIGNAPTTIFQGKTLGLYPVFTPSNASNQKVSWASSNEAVATIDQNGLVTGVSPGTAIITCTAEDGNITAQSTITVAAPVPVTGVTLTSHEIHGEGETEANPKNLSLGTALQLDYRTVPENATEQAVIWSVSNEEVLSVTDYGKVAAVGSGAAWVTVTTSDGGFTANYYIFVPDQTYPVTRVTLDAVTATVYMGEEGLDLTAAVHPSYATNQNVVWSSSDESVAAVDALGHVTAVSPGYVDITAAAQENPALKAVCRLSVQPARIRVESISFEKTEIEIGLYVSMSLTPVITPANATDKSVTWTTSNKNIVSVSRNGVITGLNTGSAVITATTADGGKVATISVLVTAGAALGDLNNDGAANAGDALLVLRAAVGLIKLSDAQAAVADVNGDGEIDAGDAVLILRYDAGLIDAFPAEN